ncbi:MAG: glycosyltransferase [Acidobacteriota bacterium]
MQPFVSIILCANGLRPMLSRCLEHLTAQNYAGYEIIVVLNGPDDISFAQAVSRFPVKLLNEPRRGVSIARNHAVPQAKGDILVFVDDDVLIGPDWLDEIVKGFADPNVACVTGRVIPAGSLSLTAERAARYYASERALSTWSLDASNPDWYQYILGEPVGFGCNMAFRKEFLENYSRFPVDLGAGSLIGGGDEFYMYVQVVKHGFRIRHTPTAAATHYFENDIDKQKNRNAQLRTGSVAFALKLFLEERTLRRATLKWVFSGAKRRARHIWGQKAIASEPQELLSPGEKLRAYARGLSVYWKSRRIKDPVSPHSSSCKRAN